MGHVRVWCPVAAVTDRVSTIYWTCPQCGRDNATKFPTDQWEARTPFDVSCRCGQRETVDPR